MSLSLLGIGCAECTVFRLVYVIVNDHSHAVLKRVFPHFSGVRVISGFFDHLHWLRPGR